MREAIAKNRAYHAAMPKDRLREFVDLVARMKIDGECEACGNESASGSIDTCEGCGGTIYRQASEDAISTLGDLIATARGIQSKARSPLAGSVRQALRVARRFGNQGSGYWKTVFGPLEKALAREETR